MLKCIAMPFLRDLKDQDFPKGYIMGNRARYVIIEDGQLHIFYSHWGVLTIPAVVASGPEATLAYIRELELLIFFGLSLNSIVKSNSLHFSSNSCIMRVK